MSEYRKTRYERESALFDLKYSIYRSAKEKRGTEKCWRLGISSDNIIMLDLDIKKRGRRKRCTIRDVEAIATWLSNLINACIAILKTEKGYHMIVLKMLPSRRRMYECLGTALSVIDREIERLRRRRIYQPLYELERIRGVIKGVAESYIESIKDTDTWDFYYEMIHRCFKEEHIPICRYINRCIDELHIEATLRKGYTTLRISGKPCKKYDIDFQELIIGYEVWGIREEIITTRCRAEDIRTPIYKRYMVEILRAVKKLEPTERTMDTIRRALKQMKECLKI